MIRFDGQIGQKLRLTAVCVFAAVGALACTADSGSAQDREPTADDVEAASELAPGHPRPVLPAGHPQVSTPQTETSALPPLPTDSGTGAMALHWEAPDGWISETPSSSMRRAQYRIPENPGSSASPGESSTGDEAECVVYYFGPGQGGDARANAERWANQFGQPDGRSSKKVLKTEELKIGGLPVLFVEVTGIYSGGMATVGGPTRALPDFMLLGAIAEGPDANWFFKLTGPRAAVTAQREAFRGLLESLSTGS